MSLVKVIELLAESEKSWEDAVNNAVQDAAKTVQNIKSVYVKDFQAIVDNNQITKYRVNVKVSFKIER